MSRFNFLQHIAPPKNRWNTFDLSHQHMTTMRFGELIPSLCLDVNPGEVFTIDTSLFLRAAPMLAPLMDRINIRHDVFFVPNRIMWVDWEDFITGQIINKAPYVRLGGSDLNTPKPGSLADYLGYPIADEYDLAEVSAFPLIGYHHIWNEYYRHQFLQTELPTTLTADENPGYVPYLTGSPVKRNWRKNRFTSAMPFPAAPTTEVNIPVSHAPDTVSVKRTSNNTAATNQTNFITTGTGNLQSEPLGSGVYFDAKHSGTINDLRTANAVQKWLERMGIGGRRLREVMFSMFGVDSKDQRLQIPELIHSSTGTMRISEVLSTAETVDSQDGLVNPVGQMAGHGMSANGTGKVTFRAPEWGWIYVITNVQPDQSFINQGRHKRLFRQSYEDYVWPQFAELGEQEITEGELYMKGQNRTNVFGYEPRYNEFKCENNRVSGDMATTLKFWNLATEFDATPALNQAFIRADVRDDIFAVQTPDNRHLWCQFYFNIKAKRNLPIFSTPALRS